MKPIKTYLVTVQGFDGQRYCARSRGMAQTACWRDYCSYEQITFHQFLKISRIHQIPNPEPVGRRIKVNGIEATQVLSRSDQYVWFMHQYVWFMHDDSDIILCSHPADVQVELEWLR